MPDATQSTPPSADPVEVPVALAERSYKIVIGQELLPQAATLLSRRFEQSSHAVLIADANVKPLVSRVTTSLQQAGWRTSSFGVPSGESSKSVDELARLWAEMLAARTDRGSVVIAVGGGVVGDLAGFAAASFARGIALVQIPTTLLSQVDSSVGGKTGINLPGAKNIVGAFWQPSLVIIDTTTLSTLPTREFVSGLAEVVKYGVIMLPDLFDYLESHTQAILDKEPRAITHIVSESCRAKAAVVQEDERETSGRRAILNYGHTFAHALESITGYGRLLHGEAVSIGMHMAALLAARLGRVPIDFVTRQEQLLSKFGLPTSFAEAEPEALWQAMQHDKKVQHGRLHFILPTRLGHVERVPDIQHEDVCEAIRQASSTTT
jgi:3-dehydroquinate synthase